MIEKIVLDYLRSVLDVPVEMETPADASGKYVLLEKTGSSEEDFICSATIAIQSYADSLYEAARLNEEVKDKMSRIDRLDEVSGAGLNTDYNFTDTRKKKYRYQAVYDLFYYQEG